MHPDLERQLAKQHAEHLRRVGEASRPRRAKAVERAESEVVIRVARHGDGPALAALAALDGTMPPVGPALLAEVDGTPLAVLPLGGERAFSDPFRHTADVLALLEARAQQVKREHGSDRPRRRFGWIAPAALRRLV